MPNQNDPQQPTQPTKVLLTQQEGMGRTFVRSINGLTEPLVSFPGRGKGDRPIHIPLDSEEVNGTTIYKNDNRPASEIRDDLNKAHRIPLTDRHVATADSWDSYEGSRVEYSLPANSDVECVNFSSPVQFKGTFHNIDATNMSTVDLDLDPNSSQVSECNIVNAVNVTGNNGQRRFEAHRVLDADITTLDDPRERAMPTEPHPYGEEPQGSHSVFVDTPTVLHHAEGRSDVGILSIQTGQLDRVDISGDHTTTEIETPQVTVLNANMGKAYGDDSKQPADSTMQISAAALESPEYGTVYEPALVVNAHITDGQLFPGAPIFLAARADERQPEEQLFTFVDDAEELDYSKNNPESVADINDYLSDPYGPDRIAGNIAPADSLSQESGISAVTFRGSRLPEATTHQASELIFGLPTEEDLLLREREAAKEAELEQSFDDESNNRNRRSKRNEKERGNDSDFGL